MSISLKLICNLLIGLFLGCFLCQQSSAKATKVEVQISDKNPAIAHVNIYFPVDFGAKSLRFEQSYADATNLAARFSNLQFFDETHNEIKVSRFADNSVESTVVIEQFSYDVNLKTFAGNLSAAHVSWLGTENGLLQTADLLPVFEREKSLDISFNLPTDWKIFTSEKSIGAYSYQVDDTEKAVFLIGKNVNEIVIEGSPGIKFYIAGEKRFESDEAAKSVLEIFKSYQKIFGTIPEKPLRIFWFSLPPEIGRDRWRGETRGTTVTILSAPTTFHASEIQRLHEQLRHEFFHLWMPNDLNLSGDYAWFYEGFAQYAALKISLESNRLRFSDFLATLSQAVALDRLRVEQVSLINAVQNQRFRESASIYARGLLVAFLCDLALIKSGKINIFDVLREIYDNHHFPQPREDANSAILRAFSKHSELNKTVENYIKGGKSIDLSVNLEESGITINAQGNLTVNEKPDRREKAILNELGYNNWRRFGR